MTGDPLIHAATQARSSVCMPQSRGKALGIYRQREVVEHALVDQITPCLRVQRGSFEPPHPLHLGMGMQESIDLRTRLGARVERGQVSDQKTPLRDQPFGTAQVECNMQVPVPRLKRLPRLGINPLRMHEQNIPRRHD